MKSQKALGFHQKYLNLSFKDEQRSYGFEWLEGAEKTEEENLCGTKEGKHSVYIGRDSCPVTFGLHWMWQSDRWKSFEMHVNTS